MFFPAAQLFEKDPLLGNVDKSFGNLASKDSVERAKQKLEERKYKVNVVETGKEALELIKTIIPEGASVHNSGSTTLFEIGFSEHLKKQTAWRNLHGEILAESDQAKQGDLRRTLGAAPDYFLTGVNAVTEEGDFMVVDWSGTRTGPIAHGAKNVIFVLSANKIVGNMADAKKRTEQYCLPLESARVRIAYANYGLKGSQINNSLSVLGSNPFATPGRYHFIIINEVSGF